MLVELKTIDHILNKITNQHIFNIKEDPESKAYNGCEFELNQHRFLYRKAKATPKKEGLFVAMWRRGVKGTTLPFTNTSGFDFYIIESAHQNQEGYFVFPREALTIYGILSTPTKEGKRGFRLYTPWNKNLNKQALNTQRWQVNYFVVKTDLEKWNNILTS